jgi:iron complex outermembrane recepter protein
MHTVYGSGALSSLKRENKMKSPRQISSLFISVSFAAMSLSVAAPAYAQDEQQAEDTAAPQNEIIVTGTRRTDRTVADSTVPVDVISAETLTQSGFTETNRLLSEQVPSFNFPQPSITDGTDVVRPATLRGLGPDQSLVLVNGKRRHTASLLNINGSVGRGTAAVDINLIPSIALSRVEVLRDGAAAQYGSDAISGVINFQLRDKPSGGKITATYGQYETSLRDVPVVTGLQLNAAGQPVLAADGTYVTTTGKNRKASDGKTLTIAGVVGLPLGPDGHINFAGEYQDRGSTNRAGYDPRRQYALVGGLVDARELTFDRLSHRYGDAATKDLKFMMNSSVQLSDAVELYSFATYGYRDGESAGFYRIASDARNVTGIYPNGFLPLINTDLNDYAGTIGLKGEVAGWRWDLSGQYGVNSFDFKITNSLNRSFGLDSPRAFDSGGLRYSQSLVNLDVSRELSLGFAQSVTLAAGLEYRRETFDIRPGEVASYANGPAGGAPGAQVFPGFRPSIGGQRVDEEKSRRNISAYAEIDAEFSDRFSLQAAGRFEDYSDFGSDWNGKLAARFEPVDGFALRGAVATGFRAPSLQQQFYAASATNNVNGVLLETVTLPVDNPVAIALGATPLDAETSISYSAGLVVTAIPGLNITADIYQIDIDDRIVVTENLQASRDAAGNPTGTNPGFSIAQILNANGFNNINAARFFVNGVDTRTRGLDIVATYRMDIGSTGKLGLTAGFNYNKTDVKRVIAAPGALAAVPGVTLFGRQETLRLSQGQPRSKINLGLDYDQGAFGLTLRGNRYGKVLGAGSDVFLDVPLSAKWVTDMEIRGTFNDRFTVALGANNLFDVYPDRVPIGRGTDPANGAGRNYPATNYFLPYSNFSPFGFNGRFLYGRISVNF